VVGLFDSGSGGLNTIRYIKEHAPDVDLVYLIDRKRAPYGIKTQEELTAITNENINTLCDMGAERVLIACCTASTVHPLINESAAQISIPIIPEIAKEAQNSTRSGRIGVIATNHTVSSHSFGKELYGYEVYERALPELVTAIDNGLCDTTAKPQDIRWIEEILTPVLDQHVDTLILGCTHFPALIKTVSAISKPYGVRAVIDSAKVGADLLLAESKTPKR
jgi:glutamate racemase